MELQYSGSMVLALTDLENSSSYLEKMRRRAFKRKTELII